MGVKKITKKYYFTVEGETEKWYLEWLKDLINSSERSVFQVVINCKICKDPVKGVKTFSVLGKTNIYHLFDYEGTEDEHEKNFKKTLDKMKEAESYGKEVKFCLGYSNLSFDLWIILHQLDCNELFANKSNYIQKINAAFGEEFDGMSEYKEKANFKRCLNKMGLSNVCEAIRRSKMIMQRNIDNGYTMHNYKNYTYFQENPSLLVWEPMSKILEDCRLLT